jgi:hypothetical protein
MMARQRRGAPGRRGWLVPPSSIALASLVLAVAMPGQAADSFAEMRLRQQVEYDTNIDLSPDERSAFGSRSVVGALVGTRTRAAELALDGEVRLVRFPGEDDLNSEDFLVNALGGWDWRRTALDLRAGLLRDTTRDVLDRETGLLAAANEERLTFDTRATLSHRPTRLDTGTVSLGFRQRVFPSLDEDLADAADLEEFSFFDLTGQWQRTVTRAFAAQAILGTSYFDSDSEESTAVQARIGATYALTPILGLDATVGPTVVRTRRDEIDGGDETNVGALFNIGLDYEPSADSRLGIEVFQELDPQSDGGELNARTGIEVEFDHQLTRLTTFSLPALIQRQEAIGGSDQDTRNFARIQPTLSHRILPNLRLDASYRFRAEAVESEDDAFSHAVFVSLSYDLPGLSGSR